MKNLRTCLITGADSGLGKAVARSLAKAGYHLILISNDEERLKVVKEQIVSETTNTAIDIFGVDLSLQSEIKLFCEKFNSCYFRLDLLIHNAGVNIPFRKITSEGFEYMFAVNYLAPFILTGLLTDKLKSAGNARIINIGSNGEKFAKFDLYNLQGEKTFNSMSQYCLTKLCNLMFTYHLAILLYHTGISVSCIHPGGIRTGIMRQYKWYTLPKITWCLLYPFLKSPEQAVKYVIDLLEVDPAKANGKYFSKEKESKSSPTSFNKEFATQLWEHTLSLNNCTTVKNNS